MKKTQTKKKLRRPRAKKAPPAEEPAENDRAEEVPEVGADPRQYETEELKRQGYTDKGLEESPGEGEEKAA